MMKRWFALVLLVALVASCAGPKVLSEFKGELSCAEYQHGMGWDQVAAKFGTPEITPLPEPGTDLSMNARGYRDMTVIFYTKRQQVNEDGKIRFKEVVYKIEICKRK
jgi:hypothetical protein